MLFLLYSQLILSSVSVVFDFNTSLNDVAPMPQMKFPIDLSNVKECVVMDAICVLFLLSSLLRLSFVSVVFDFSTSLNDAAPLSPILLPVDFM